MVSTTITIPAAKFPIVVEAVKALYPVPLDEEGEAVHTDNANVKYQMEKFIIRTVKRHKQQLSNEANRVFEDDSLVS